MNLEQLGKRDARLAGLLQQSQQWRRLDAAVKRILPTNLHPHFQTACIEEGRLVLLAANGMAASRLKMILPALVPQLQELNAGIRDVAVKVVPKPPAQPKVNSLLLSGAALESFDAAAAKLEDKHPELAAALAELVRKHSR
jgi:hypothetical protein